MAFFAEKTLSVSRTDTEVMELWSPCMGKESVLQCLRLVLHPLDHITHLFPTILINSVFSLKTYLDTQLNISVSCFRLLAFPIIFLNKYIRNSYLFWSQLAERSLHPLLNCLTSKQIAECHQSWEQPLDGATLEPGPGTLWRSINWPKLWTKKEI